jgi:hypothetical protein
MTLALPANLSRSQHFVSLLLAKDANLLIYSPLVAEDVNLPNALVAEEVNLPACGAVTHDDPEKYQQAFALRHSA